LGGAHFDRLNEERTKGYLVKRLEKLGFEVELNPKKGAAKPLARSPTIELLYK
jgi:hypothetical protein